MTKLKAFGGLILIWGLGACSHKPVQDREPAAATTGVISSDEAKILAQMIGDDSPVRRYRHPAQVSFYTNSDKKYLADNTKKAFQEAMAESLGKDDPEHGLGKIFAGNLKTAIIENFVKTLRVHKIINTGLQFDITFAPTHNRPSDFSMELSSNQLVNLGQMGGLAAKMVAIEKGTFTGTIYNNSSLIPVNPRGATYIGGVATVFIEILDTNPRIRLPNPTKNGVKGFIRYRRYYRVEQASNVVTCNKFTLSSLPTGKGVPTFYTVDLYKNFDLKNLIPTPETIEVYPGLVATTNVGRSQMLPGKDDSIGQSISTASFDVSQKKAIGGVVTITLQKLVYGAADKKLDLGQSEATLKSGGLGLTVKQMKKDFLSECEVPLAKMLQLEGVIGEAL